MRKRLLCAVWAATIWAGMCFGADEAKESSAPFVGYVETSEDKPNEVYQLFRGGKPEPVSKETEVRNNDEILPAAGKQVRLIYYHTGCEKQVVTTKTTVSCSPPSPVNEGKIWLVSDLIEGFGNWLKEKNLKKIVVITSKGTNEDASCFPAPAFCLSVFPPNLATVLSGEPIFFRWYMQGQPCSDAILVIEPKNGKSAAQRINMKIGELKSLDANLMKAGEAYEWYIEQESKPLSEKYGFRVLNEAESNNIRTQLAELGKTYGKESLTIVQAWYLQRLSDAAYPEFNFYADSLRLIYSEKAEVPEKLINDLHSHCFR